MIIICLSPWAMGIGQWALGNLPTFIALTMLSCVSQYFLIFIYGNLLFFGVDISRKRVTLTVARVIYLNFTIFHVLLFHYITYHEGPTFLYLPICLISYSIFKIYLNTPYYTTNMC